MCRREALAGGAVARGARRCARTIGVADKQRKMRVAQLWNWIYVRGVTRFDQMTSVSKDLRAALDESWRPEVVAKQVSVTARAMAAALAR